MNETVLTKIPENTLSLKPNPVKNKLQIIQMVPEHFMGEFLNLSGKKIKEIVLKSKINSFDLSDLEKGIYLLRILNLNKKIVKIFYLTKE